MSSPPISPLTIPGQSTGFSSTIFAENTSSFQWPKNAEPSGVISPPIMSFENMYRPLSPPPVNLATDPLVSTIVNISSQLVSEKAQTQKLEQDNQHLRSSLNDLETNTPKIDTILSYMRQIHDNVERHKASEAALSAYRDEISSLHERLADQQRLNFSVERKIESMPLCYNCHENRKAQVWSAQSDLPYGEDRKPRKRMRVE
jgi:hypothetical protein